MIRYAQSSETPMPAHQLDELAQRRANALQGWYTHATIYAYTIGCLALLGIWQGRYWPLGPALGWGIGLTIHGLNVFAKSNGSRLRDKLVKRERQRLQRMHR